MPQTKYIRWVPSPNNIKRIGRIHTWLYVCTAGVVGSRVDGLDILLLTTTGRKTGRKRRVPLPYIRDGERYVVIGSFGGNAKNPAWVGNLLEHPDVRVQLGAKRWSARAYVARDAERERLWSALTHEFPRYANYQTRTERQIPLVVLG